MAQQSFLQELEIPDQEQEDDDTTWDSTFQEIGDGISVGGSTSLCAHAVAFGSTIFRMKPGTSDCWAWQVTIDPNGKIMHLASNADGSVIVGATSTKKVALLRGFDGKELARRTEHVQQLQWISPDRFWMDTGSKIVLVSNVQGDMLNHAYDEAVVAGAVQTMEISVLQKEDTNLKILAVTPSLRVLTCEESGHLKIFDCIDEDRLLPVPPQSAMNIPQIDAAIGLRIQGGLRPDRLFVVGSYIDESSPKVFWLDPKHLEISCEFTIEEGNVEKLEPIHGLENDSACSVAVMVKTSSKSSLLILQILIEEDGNISHPHVIYTIHEPHVMAANLSAVPGSPFAVRYKIWSEPDTATYKCFCPDVVHAIAIGTVRSALLWDKLNNAKEIAAKNSDILPNEFTDFHPSEINWMFLKNALKQSGTESVQATCLRELAEEATRSETGLEWFLRSVDLLRSSETSMSPEKFQRGLSVLQSVVKNVLASPSLSSSSTKELNKRLDMTNHQSRALEFFVTNQVQVKFPFQTIRSPRHLYTVLVKESQFDLARKLCLATEAEGEIDTSSIVLAFSQLSSDIDPRAYFRFLREVIFPRLLDGDPLLFQVKGWVCRTADLLDHKKQNLDSAICLLEVVDEQVKLLEARVHASFGRSSPFVEQSESESKGTSKSSSISSSKSKMSSLHQNPMPTILELSTLRGGAQRSINRFTFDGDTVNVESDCVSDKLNDAQFLQQARHLGVAHEIATLKDFTRMDRRETVVKALIRLFSLSSEDHEDRLQKMNDLLRPLCTSASVSLDDCILECTQELCKGKSATAEALDESCSLARCCSSKKTGGEVALVVLRAARLSGRSHAGVHCLSKEAMSWATCDTSMRSELEEATRLLLVDGIVVKYCGQGARDLFLVQNPRHSMRLLEYVMQHVGRTHDVVGDALVLCDSFQHISRANAARRLIQNAVMHPKATVCENLVEQFLSRDPALAVEAMIGLVTFVEEILSSNKARSCFGTRNEMKEKAAKQVCERVCIMLSQAAEASLALPEDVPELRFLFGCTSLDNVRSAFLRIERLQKESNIFVSVADLSDGRSIIETSQSFLEGAVVCDNGREALKTSLSRKKNAIGLLANNLFAERDLWGACILDQVKAVILKSDAASGFSCLGLLSGIGLLSEESPQSLCTLVAALVVSSRYSAVDKGPKNISLALAILQDWALGMCPAKILPRLCHMAAHLEVVFQALVRCDEPIGEEIEADRDDLRQQAIEQCFDARIETDSHMMLPQSVSRPILHRNWQIQDGLLLPTRPAAIHCAEYGFGTLVEKELQHSLDLFHLVSNAGAHNLAMKSLYTTVGVYGFPRNCASAVRKAETVMSDTVTALAERSFGGTGSGITSSIVDSQTALLFLVGMPMREAFALFGSCLPTAIHTEDYKRLLALAKLGTTASKKTGNDHRRPSPLMSIEWRNQDKFNRQCSELVQQVQWFSVLRECGVAFRPQGFQMNSQSARRKYATSLLPQVFEKLRSKYDMGEVSRLSKAFSNSFGLSNDVFIVRFVEFLLRPQKVTNLHHAIERRASLVQSEKLVLISLRDLGSSLKKAGVLRKTLVILESSRESDKDYTLYQLVLSLYQTMLQSVLDSDLAVQNVLPDPYEVELELVDRRIDVLEMLSSFYDGPGQSSRPAFPAFFQPLPSQFDHDRVDLPELDYDILCGVSPEKHHFDPLAHVIESLQRLDPASVSALSPITASLGLPSGSIAVRHLVSMFRHAKRLGHQLPSFELDVAPVCKKILDARNRRRFAEWCSTQYDMSDDNRLSCLDVMAESATQESLETETVVSQTEKSARALVSDSETKVLEMMKEKVEARDWFAERQKVKSILLKSEGIGPDTIVGDAVRLLVDELDEQARSCTRMQPEELVDFLLQYGSNIACNLTLGPHGMPIPHLRTFSSVVHNACRYVANQHSHVDFRQRAHFYAQSWLFFGEPTELSLQPEKPQQQDGEKSPTHEEEGTISFVMDLSKIQSGDQWRVQGDVLGPNPVASVEECSVLRACSAREASEHAARRTALRVAFVLAFCGATSEGFETEAKENSGQNQLKDRIRGSRFLGTGKALKKKSKNDDETAELCHLLLGIVFASPAVLAQGKLSGFSSSGKRQMQVPSTITFAMRHRALRAASILCPQICLEQVSVKENFLSHNDVCSMGMCTFGLFIAKEMEEMGLSLPHPDLKQLSTMNFLSNAKALWRRHRADNLESRGRLLLLLCEMGLRSREVDVKFLNELLTEMGRHSLPRTLLLALESLSESKHFKSLRAGGMEVLKQALDSIVGRVQSELRRLDLTSTPTDLSPTMLRVAKIIAQICEDTERLKYQSMFSNWLSTKELDPMARNVPPKVVEKIVSILASN